MMTEEELAAKPTWKREWIENRERVRERDAGVCQICGGRVRGRGTIDHIVPRSKGGGDELSNLQLAHENCNQQKGDGPPATRPDTRPWLASLVDALEGGSVDGVIEAYDAACDTLSRDRRELGTWLDVYS